MEIIVSSGMSNLTISLAMNRRNISMIFNIYSSICIVLQYLLSMYYKKLGAERVKNFDEIYNIALQ